MEIKMSDGVILWSKRNEMKAYLESWFGACADASVERSQQLVSSSSEVEASCHRC